MDIITTRFYLTVARTSRPAPGPNPDVESHEDMHGRTWAAEAKCHPDAEEGSRPKSPLGYRHSPVDNGTTALRPPANRHSPIGNRKSL